MRRRNAYTKSASDRNLLPSDPKIKTRPRSTRSHKVSALQIPRQSFQLPENSITHSRFLNLLNKQCISPLPPLEPSWSPSFSFPPSLQPHPSPTHKPFPSISSHPKLPPQKSNRTYPHWHLRQQIISSRRLPWTTKSATPALLPVPVAVVANGVTGKRFLSGEILGIFMQSCRGSRCEMCYYINGGTSQTSNCDNLDGIGCTATAAPS